MLLALFAGAALLGMSACNDSGPNDIPRTVPPTPATDSAAAPVVKGSGPAIEAALREFSRDRHTADRAQSNTFCSSVDPWHEGSVINDHGDQVGFDLFYTSGITRGLPAMIPVAMPLLT
jgi:hypothetical protein